MELISRSAKKIMEECKIRAEAAGLVIKGETLEYIVTNRDLTELSSKVMIPTLYDYWVHDVEVIRDKWIYDAFPHNPYETVINTRPAISFYNDNNPDWLNTMIFYHVLGHIDFFQNNIFYRKTWDDDFCGQALADKRLINRIREELGAEKRWVDYVIEFAKGIDNLVGYYAELEEADKAHVENIFGIFSERANFYFGEFMRNLYDKGTVELKFYYGEIERYNLCLRQLGQDRGEDVFFSDYDFRSKFPEFNGVFAKQQKKEKVEVRDILQHLAENSEFINKEQNKWMKDIIHVVRKTSLYFEPQMRTKIANEGWASFWHERLFIPDVIADERISGHKVDFAKVNAGVLLNPRVGFNPYVVGMHLFEFIEELASKGKLSYGFQLIRDSEARKHYDKNLGPDFGKKVLFEARKNFNDFLLVNFLSDNDFQDFVNRYNLFVAGVRFSRRQWGLAEIYIKSRSGEEYRKMLNKFLYHPPHILINEEKSRDGGLYINHVFEGRTLVTKYISAVLIGLSYFCGGNKVQLETTEFEADADREFDVRAIILRGPGGPDGRQQYKKLRVLYTCEKKNVSRTVLSEEAINE